MKTYYDGEGWWVTERGYRIAGPFDTQAEAEEWITTTADFRPNGLKSGTCSIHGITDFSDGYCKACYDYYVGTGKLPLSHR